MSAQRRALIRVAIAVPAHPASDSDEAHQPAELLSFLATSA
jgi:hypothetical protein